MPEIPDIPDMPTHVVPMDQPGSPEWARQEHWEPTIKQLCVPCKEHGVLPIVSEHLLKVSSSRPLAMGALKVHCPNKECRFFAGDYDPKAWNREMR